MHINATHNLTPLPERGPRTASASRDVQDAADFTETEFIAQQLRESPGVRPEAVDRARSLISMPAYPPEKTMRGIATLLAINLRAEQS